MHTTHTHTHRFFTKRKILYDRLSDDDRSLVYIFPKKTVSLCVCVCVCERERERETETERERDRQRERETESE